MHRVICYRACQGRGGNQDFQSIHRIRKDAILNIACQQGFGQMAAESNATRRYTRHCNRMRKAGRTTHLQVFTTHFERTNNRIGIHWFFMRKTSKRSASLTGCSPLLLFHRSLSITSFMPERFQGQMPERSSTRSHVVEATLSDHLASIHTTTDFIRNTGDKILQRHGTEFAFLA